MKVLLASVSEYGQKETLTLTKTSNVLKILNNIILSLLIRNINAEMLASEFVQVFKNPSLKLANRN
jgi:hypothetical protein